MKFKRENKGFSLIELVVVIAIFSIVTVAVGGFLFAASRSYSINANELNLQDEAQLVANQMQEMILDTAYGISYKYVVTDDTGAELINFMENDAATLPAGDLAQKDLYIYGKDQYFHITWDAEEEKLYLMEYEKLAGATDYTPVAGMETLAPKGVMFGQYIKDFQVDLTKVASDRMVSFNILFAKNGSNRDYLVARNVSLRNDVMTNKETLEVYAAAGIEIQPKADKIEVVPNAPVTLWPGETQQYRITLICSKGGVPSQSATWSVNSLDATVHADTKVSSSNLLTISADEASSELKLDVYADGYNYTTNADEEIRPSGADLSVHVRQIQGLTITDNNFEDDGFPITKGGTYKIKVRMDGVNLPANVTDAGGIIAQFTAGGSYASITDMTVNGMIAEFTIQISDTAPENGEIGLTFKPARPEFADIHVDTPIYSFTGTEDSALVISSTSGLEWLRLGTAKTKVEFASSDFKDTICKADGSLNAGYSIRYTYRIYDSAYTLCRTLTSTVGSTTATVVDADYVSNILHNSVYEAEAILSDKVFLQSGTVVVNAELVHNTGGTPVVIGTSDNLTYFIPEASIGFRKSTAEIAKSNLKVYITKDANTAPIYVNFASGFAAGNYKVSLDKIACSNTALGSVSSGLSDVSKNLITIAGNKNADYNANPSNTMTYTYGGLSNKVEVILVTSNVTGTDYYVPADKSEWTLTKTTGSGTKKYEYYSYYIDDTHRMDVVYYQGAFNSATFYYYENMTEKNIKYILDSSTKTWNLK